VDKKEIIYGRNPVLEYIRSAESGKNLELFVNRNARGKIIKTILHEAKGKEIRISYPEKSFFSDLGSSSVHQGVALAGVERSGITRGGKGKEDIDTLLKRVSEKKGVLVFLDQLTDPHNVGSIIRTAEALGCDGVITTKSHSPGITSTVVKSSAGATAYIPVVTAGNTAGFISRAKDAGFWLAGTSGDGDTDLSRAAEYRPLIIVIGSEERGMRRILKDECDIVVAVKLPGKISSLNASVAAGIIIHGIVKNQSHR
jgi:23S rRNA (guanosine2251-2'-O)-methyltransferase